METTGTAPQPAPPAPGRPGERACRAAGRALLVMGVLGVGALVGVLGPLFAISCASCQDGVRSPARFDGALVALAVWGVPLATLGTVVGILVPRGGIRAAGAGLGVLMLLLFTMLVLGQYPA